MIATRAAVAATRRGLGALGADLAALLLPQRCPGCAAEARADRLLCDPCHRMIPRLSMPLCARCLARGREPVGCRAHPSHTVHAAWVYDERAARVVHALKYEERVGLARALGTELARVAPPAPRADAVLAVPLHPARRRERGYNQAALLADALSDAIGAPRLDGVIERARPTRPQARLGPRARRANVTGAFRVTRPGWIEGRNLLIVDDVMTTGATLEACLESLADAGASARAVALAWAQ
jgi:ComF family protein